MSKKSHLTWIMRVKHMINAIEKIQSYTQGMDEERFYQDQKTIDAVERNFEILGEASSHIPEDIQNQYSHIEWRKIKSMRNFVIHDYDDVEHDILWETIRQNLPDLKISLEKILENVDG
jgi:uncharacterized protein with HEPN domain